MAPPTLPDYRDHCFAHGSGSISFNRKGEFFQDKVSQGYRRAGVKNSYTFQEIDGEPWVNIQTRSCLFLKTIFFKGIVCFLLQRYQHVGIYRGGFSFYGYGSSKKRLLFGSWDCYGTQSAYFLRRLRNFIKNWSCRLQDWEVKSINNILQFPHRDFGYGDWVSPVTAKRDAS